MAEETHPNLSGNYCCDRNENFDAFLAENGVPWLVRKMVGSSKPDLEVAQDGNSFHFKLVSMIKSRENKFTIGEETEETQPDGTVMKITAEWEGDKLVVKLVPKEEGKGKAQKHIRQIVGEELVMTLEIGDVVAKRFFKKVVA